MIFQVETGNSASNFARHFIINKDSFAEDWAKWLMAY
jgi:hypothetical protein